MIPLSEQAFAAGKFEDSAYFEPFYLKEFQATVAKNKVLGRTLRVEIGFAGFLSLVHIRVLFLTKNGAVSGIPLSLAFGGIV